MTLQIEVSEEAEAQIQVIDDWWQEHRPAAPNMFLDELAEAFATISTAPLAAPAYARSVRPGIRRILMRSTRHFVYYLPGEEAVLVVAVWGSTKGSEPDLNPH